jgi:hypothetical protein
MFCDNIVITCTDRTRFRYAGSPSLRKGAFEKTRVISEIPMFPELQNIREFSKALRVFPGSFNSFEAPAPMKKLNSINNAFSSMTRNKSIEISVVVMLTNIKDGMIRYRQIFVSEFTSSLNFLSTK